MSNFDTPQYRLASAINDLATRIGKLEAFDNAIFEIKTTTGRPTARGNYHFVINTFDDTVEIYADGAWEDLIGAGGGGYTDEEAQDAVGTILTDTATIDFTYDDATPEITADVIPGGVDHDSLLNFVANEHIDHTAVTLTAGSHLSGGGDISANRTFDVDDDFILNTGDQMDGVFIIDETGTEVFLIRQDADAADVFIVNTTNRRVGINVTPSYALDIQQIADYLGLYIRGYDDLAAEYVTLRYTNADAQLLSSHKMIIQTQNGEDLELHSDNNLNIILGDAAGADKISILDSGSAEVATINSDGRISSGGAIDTNFGITIRELGDDEGIVIYGYDDQSAQFLQMYVDSAGSAYVYADEELFLESETSYVYSRSSGHIYEQLGDSAGSNRWYIRDSGNVNVASINSNGKAYLKELVFTDGGSVVDIIRDEDDMTSDDANALATQQSIKAYIDSLILANVGNCSIETGTYTGDGAISQAISLTNSSLEVKAIWIYEQETAHVTRSQSWFTTDTIIDDNAAGLAFCNYYITTWGNGMTDYTLTNRIIGLGTGDFTVDDAGANAGPNENGVIYNYLVLGIPTGSGSPAFMETGTYTGDGTLDQTITLADTNLVVRRVDIWNDAADNGNSPTYLTTDTFCDNDADGLCVILYAGGSGAVRDNRIKSLGTGNFHVDDDGSDSYPNSNGIVFNYTVWGTH